MGDRWHRHQDARHDQEDPSKQPATNTTSHNVHLPPACEYADGRWSVDGVERDAGMGDRWHRHQHAGDDQEDAGIQPATKTTSHNVHLPPSRYLHGPSNQSRKLNVMPALAADGNATNTPETTKKMPANSQPRTRRVMILTSLLGPIQELTRIRRGRDIRLDRAAGPLTGH